MSGISAVKSIPSHMDMSRMAMRVARSTSFISWSWLGAVGYKVLKDAVITPKGVEAWDWKETHMHHDPGVRRIDVEPIVDTQEITTMILTTGFKDKLKIQQSAIDYLLSKGIEVSILSTRTALEFYNNVAFEKHRHVAALIHTTC